MRKPYEGVQARLIKTMIKKRILGKKIMITH